MRILAIDPGNEQSAWVVYADGKPARFGKQPNTEILEAIKPMSLAEVIAGHRHADVLAIEMIASYGMPVGREVFETCVWVGRFIQQWQGRHEFVYRKDVKLHLCGQARAKDANIRQALIDRYGGKTETKKGGLLHGVSGDVWSALAVAVTYADGAVKQEAA